MPNVSTATRTNVVSGGPTIPAQYDHFMPTKVSTSGGVVSLTGNVNRSIVADIRMSKGGAFTASTHMWSGPSGRQTAMTKTEMKGLRTSLQNFMETARLTKPSRDAYQSVLDGLDKALGTSPASTKVTKATTQKLVKATQAALKNPNLKWNSSMPLGPHSIEVPLFNAPRGADGYHYSALVNVGVLAPGAKVGDPNKATNFVIKRTGGFAGLTSYSGPITLK